MKPPTDAIYLYPVEIAALENPATAPPGALVNLTLIGVIA